MSKNYTAISKEISYALRHKPEEYSLVLDAEGWVEIDTLLDAINLKKHDKVSLDDIKHIIATSEKKRFELVDGMIRACYGHSFEAKISYKAQTPPAVLYHGTTHAAISNILKEGVLPMNRQYVHLSADKNTAMIVGKRRDSHPIILVVDAHAMELDGHKFYLGNDSTWLTDKVEAKYITFNTASLKDTENEDKK